MHDIAQPTHGDAVTMRRRAIGSALAFDGGLA
jgi:hypothetical protein